MAKIKKILKNVLVFILAVIFICFLYVDLKRYHYSYFIRKDVPLNEYLSTSQSFTPLIPLDNNDIFRVSAIESDQWPFALNLADMGNFYDTLGYGNPLFAKYFDYRGNYGFDSKYYDLLNVKYFITTTQSQQRLSPYLSENLTFAFEIPNIIQPSYHLNQRSSIQAYENKNRLGYAWLVDDFMLYKNKYEDREMIENPDGNIDLKKTAIVDQKTGALLSDIKSGQLSYTIDVQKRSNNYLRLEVSSNKKALLILSELFYPGWKVYIDGEKSEIFEVNHILRGNKLEKGTHTIEYKYSPTSFQIGFILSVAGMLFAIGGIVWNIYKNLIKKYV